MIPRSSKGNLQLIRLIHLSQFSLHLLTDKAVLCLTDSSKCIRNGSAECQPTSLNGWNTSPVTCSSSAAALNLNFLSPALLHTVTLNAQALNVLTNKLTNIVRIETWFIQTLKRPSRGRISLRKPSLVYEEQCLAPRRFGVSWEFGKRRFVCSYPIAGKAFGAWGTTLVLRAWQRVVFIFDSRVVETESLSRRLEIL